MQEAYNIGNKLMIHDIDGHRIFLDPNELHMTAHMLEHKEWEPHVREILKVSLWEGATFVDVGANIGLHSVYAGDIVGENGNVICFEPNDRVYKILQDNVDINGLQARVKLYNKAVSDYEGKTDMYIYEGHASGSGLAPNEGFMQACLKKEVSVARLAGLGIKKIDCLKIDVEGFEYSVLKGADYLLDNPDITIILEWQPHDIIRALGNETPALLLKFLCDDKKFKIYKSAYCKELEEVQPEQMIELLHIKAADLVFTRKNHLDEMIERKKLMDYEFSNHIDSDNEELAREIRRLHEKLDFSKKAFYDAVKVQDDLKKIINEPCFKDLLRCCRNFLFPRK